MACRTQVDKPWTGRRDTHRHATTVKVRRRTFIHIYVSMTADSVETMLSNSVLNSFTSYSTSQRHAGPAPLSWKHNCPGFPPMSLAGPLQSSCSSFPLTRTLNVEGLQSMSWAPLSALIASSPWVISLGSLLLDTNYGLVSLSSMPLLYTRNRSFS